MTKNRTGISTFQGSRGRGQPRAHYPLHCVLAQAPWKESLDTKTFPGSVIPRNKDEVQENKAGMGQNQNKKAFLS